MSTRGLYNFGEGFNVYCHYDNYPSGAKIRIEKAIPLAWDLPRYEPDEFGAAFIAGNKHENGGVRLMPNGDPMKVCLKNCPDIEYLYEIYAVGKKLWVKAYSVDPWRTKDKTKIYEGPVENFVLEDA